MADSEERTLNRAQLNLHAHQPDRNIYLNSISSVDPINIGRNQAPRQLYLPPQIY